MVNLRKLFSKKRGARDSKGKLLHNVGYQNGTRKSIPLDRARKAIGSGKRRSGNKKIYYEYRRDHTDLENNL